MCNIFKFWKRYKNLIRRQKTDTTTKINYNNLTIKTQKIMELSFHVGEFVVATLGLVDHTTQEVVEATFSNPQNSSSNEAVVTVDAENKLVAVGEGTADVTLQSDVTYTDANTSQNVTATKSQVVTVTITVPPVPQEVDLVVSFSEAQPV